MPGDGRPADDGTDRYRLAEAVERDVCLLYHRIAESPVFSEPPGDVDAFVLPYWDFLKDDAGRGRAEPLREGCLVMILHLALAAIGRPHSPFREKAPLCRLALDRLEAAQGREDPLSLRVRFVLEALARGEREIAPELRDACAFVARRYVHGWFRRKARPPRPPLFFREDDPDKADRAAMDEHVRLAEEAYARMYDARPGADAAAAYSDCKESLSEAIALARKTGLEERARELEERRMHVRDVFRGGMSS